MKNIFIMIIFLFLASCSSDEESVSFEDKYQGWVSREDFSQVYEEEDLGASILTVGGRFSNVEGYRYYCVIYG
jgi:TPP-dependent 2-oxoacid decarboxylase